MLLPVILSGGAGTRLWPVSREALPKPFITLPDGDTLIKKTMKRALALEASSILTVTNREYFFHTKDEYEITDETSGIEFDYILEPTGRNTAPAVAVSALYASERHGLDTTLLVMPADHLITNHAAFDAAVKKATQLAGQGLLVTFGVIPDRPETGFGYIDRADELAPYGYKVKRFVEKPDLDTAQTYLEAGTFYWNSGMFCFTAGAILDEMAKYCPEILEQCRLCLSCSPKNQHTTELDSRTFGAVRDDSIDYAVMEKSTKVAVTPCDIGWSDIGSWLAMSNLVPADARQNRFKANVIDIDTNNTFVWGEKRLIATIGLKNLMIIDTADALLVADESMAQDVKKVVQYLKKSGGDAHRLHQTAHRPWGTYTVLEEGERFKIKRIVVKSGAALSLQMHYHRSEHWIVVSGTAKVVNGDKEFLIRVNESTYIPAGTRHRLSNPGVIELVMIEVQSGDYLGEDDIVRFDDVYGRDSKQC